jgi:RNA recognition motif-containing protein
MFERYGRLRKVTVQIDHYTGRNKGFAFVEFEDRRDAEDAFDKYNGTNVEGRRLKLDWDIGLGKKDQHRREKYGTLNDYGRSADPYGRGASPLGLRAFSPNYRTGGRSASPYRRWIVIGLLGILVGILDYLLQSIDYWKFFFFKKVMEQ